MMKAVTDLRQGKLIQPHPGSRNRDWRARTYPWWLAKIKKIHHLDHVWGIWDNSPFVPPIREFCVAAKIDIPGWIRCFCDCPWDELSVNRLYSMPWLTGETVCRYWIHPDTLCWSGSFTFWKFEAYFAFRVHLEIMTTIWARWSIPGYQLVSGMVSLSFLVEVEHVWRRFTWFWAKIHPERARAYQCRME